VLGAFDYLVNKGVPSNEIGVLGFSMGAATSALSVAQEPKIQALAIDSAFANVSDMIAQETALKTPIPEFAAYTFIPGMDTFAKLFYGIDIGEIVPEYAVKRLDYPILIIHGLGDTRISSENSNRIFGAAHESSELWLVPGVEHTGTVRTYPEEYIDRVTAYLDARLRAD
jgi:fermentation-respiration switch protein FrsA (DUF1100 family)